MPQFDSVELFKFRFCQIKSLKTVSISSVLLTDKNMTIWMHVKLTLNQISYVTIRNPVTKSLYVYKSGIFKILKNQSITNLNLKYYHFS